MPLPDFTDEEHAELTRVIREAIDGDRYPFSARVKRLKSVLAKIDPASLKSAVVPYPAPKPAAEPSHLYNQLRGQGRRRR